MEIPRWMACNGVRGPYTWEPGPFHSVESQGCHAEPCSVNRRASGARSAAQAVTSETGVQQAATRRARNSTSVSFGSPGGRLNQSTIADFFSFCSSNPAASQAYACG
jgi:hypothetical protein